MQCLVSILIILAASAGCRKTRDQVAEQGSGYLEGIPSVVIKGLPKDYSREVSLEIELTGINIESFRYKLTDNPADSCIEEIGYGDEQVIQQSIILDLRTLKDGEILFCLVAKSKSGNWQGFKNASTANWVKKTVGPKPLDSIVSREGVSQFKLSWQRADDLQYFIFRSPEKVELPLLVDGHQYVLGDIIGPLSLVYAGSDNFFIDDNLVAGLSYFYYIYTADELNNYSIPLLEALETFGTPYKWVVSGQSQEAYEGLIKAGAEIGVNGSNTPLFICRADFATGDIVPGQLIFEDNAGQGTCRSLGPGEFGATVQTQENYEVLVSTRKDFDQYFSWIRFDFNAAVIQAPPPTAILGGDEGEVPLFLCRGAFANRFFPGKIGSTYGRCKAPAFDGAVFERPNFNSWEILTVIPRQPILDLN